MSAIERGLGIGNTPAPIWIDENKWGYRSVSRERKDLFLRSSQAVIDRETLSLVEVERLHETIDHTQTTIGSLTLFESLVSPSTDIGLIQSKQDAVVELTQNEDLRRSLSEYLSEYREHEADLFNLLDLNIDPTFPYRRLKKGVKEGKRIHDLSNQLDLPQSDYLRLLIQTLRDFGETQIYQLMRGPIYRGIRKLKSREQVHFPRSLVHFEPRRFSKGVLVSASPMLLEMANITHVVDPESVIINEPLLMLYMMTFTGPPLYAMLAKPVRDYWSVIRKIAQISLKDEEFLSAFHTVGKLDELMSFVQMSMENPKMTVLPQITDDPDHSFTAEGLRNPVLANNAYMVPNDIELSSDRLTFLTGPNSGGKTTLCKTVVQSQILSQIGSPIFAHRASVNIADRISYQAPRFDALEDVEGRFGTELQRSASIFYASTPKSLVVLDELAEGTTLEEKMAHSRAVLSDFEDLGATTILVTHNHALVDAFQNENRGQFLQTQFDGYNPTYRIIPGISRVSHAERVVERIGFSERDRKRHIDIVNRTK